MHHVDVLIVGAGLSGIGAACHIQQKCPGRQYMILESRDTIGGTWDLFRYPGIRSDSDMHTLGYSFKPWVEAEAIADGPNILRYVKATAEEYGVTPHIRFNHEVRSANWSSKECLWTVTAYDRATETEQQFTCNFLYTCAGYYNYEQGYVPEFEGINNFKGRVAHPQKWTEDIDYQDKEVVIVGSGATAVTLVPAMAKKAKHVTMLQRSPTYIVSLPAKDKVANFLRRIMPDSWAYGLVRLRNILVQQFFYRLMRARPEKSAERIIERIRKEIGEKCDVDKHFTPRYDPWDQRLCLVPDGDLYEAINDGSASVVTDHISHFTEEGITLKSGDSLPADIVVLATGLELRLVGGMTISVDGQSIDFAETVNYKGSMFSGVPNFVSVFGYTNASWTLKADLVAEYVCRLLNHMAKNGLEQCMPTLGAAEISPEPWVDFSSGYIQRAMHLFPKQGVETPWRINQNYLKDKKILMRDPIDDGAMVFSKKPAKHQEDGETAPSKPADEAA